MSACARYLLAVVLAGIVACAEHADPAETALEPGTLTTLSLDPNAGLRFHWAADADTALTITTHAEGALIESLVRLDGTEVETRVVTPRLDEPEPMQHMERYAWESVLHTNRATVSYFREPGARSARIRLWRRAIVDIVPALWESAASPVLRVHLTGLYLHEVVARGVASDW
jgi:hypothetical protein